MALRAATSIQHFREVEPVPETERVLIPAGELVDESMFSDGELDELKSRGAVVEEGDLQKEEDLRRTVEDLQRKLAQQDQELQLARSQQRSPGTLFQTPAVTEESVEDLGEDNDPPPGNATPAVVGNDPSGGKVVKDGDVKTPKNQAK
jgi:hypothetical protein